MGNEPIPNDPNVGKGHEEPNDAENKGISRPWSMMFGEPSGVLLTIFYDMNLRSSPIMLVSSWILVDS